MKEIKPTITIVTVTYNAEEYLERTIKSIIKQDYLNIEYIIIDGLSTDKTVDIIKKYEDHINYWISEPDKGIYDAMNKGIDIATGEWIQFLNAGDLLVGNNTLTKVSTHLLSKNDLVHGLMWRNKPIRKLTSPSHTINEPLNGCFIWHPTLFTKLSIMKKHKFNDTFRIAGDYNFFLECIKENYKIKFIEEPIVDYLENGVSQIDDLRSYIETLFAQLQYTNNSKELLKSNIMKSFLNQIPFDNLDFSKRLNMLIKNAHQLFSNKKFILYGYGFFGKLIYQEFKDNIILIVDKNYQKLSNNPIVKSVEELSKVDKSSFIFISVLGREEEIKNNLTKEFQINPSNILICNDNESFISSEYWKERYEKGGNSGTGSYNHLAQFKADVINNFIQTNNLKNILEFGCGDGNNLALYDIKNYVGIDISSKAIELCKLKFNQDSSKKFFVLDDFIILDKDKITAEVVLSLDVIYHLIEDEIFDKHMNNLFDSSSKYIVIYASNFDEILCDHVKHRKFTNWIESNRKDWKIKEFIKNKYEYDVNKPEETSFADFYIFEKIKS